MVWNHRLVYQPEEGVIKIMEVYYDAEGVPFGASEASFIYDNIFDKDEEMTECFRSQLASMAEALNLPILYLDRDFIGRVPS